MRPLRCIFPAAQAYGNAVEDTLDTWFKREVLVHEAILLRYLNRVWSRRDEVADLRQEIYMRVYEAAKASRPRSPKSFLSVTARHLITDRLRRSKIVSIEAVGDLDDLNVSVDELSPDRHLDARQQLKRLAQALNNLPPKCRQVIWMRRIDELPQKEVAKRLGVSVRTVEDQVQKGMRLLADTFFAGGMSRSVDHTTPPHESESEHGKYRKD
jgi:RNA polymerase sigma-70 factor (ECF subfamily)